DSIPAMQRPGGGLAPGEAWAETSMSWTPETALYAWAAAANDQPERARALLDWIESHRTSIGAIPEKVDPDGSPAHVAPLAWSDALVLLTLTELESTGEQSAG
ncbi:MAG TPA: glycoside hydrolase family 15, partial [Beutenbergiaceae bacterium]|nr:glycoside hydrolase family 15 [Beutenbergiaceae bacterium]